MRFTALSVAVLCACAASSQASTIAIPDTGIGSINYTSPDFGFTTTGTSMIVDPAFITLSLEILEQIANLFKPKSIGNLIPSISIVKVTDTPQKLVFAFKGGALKVENGGRNQSLGTSVLQHWSVTNAMTFERRPGFGDDTIRLDVSGYHIVGPHPKDGESSIASLQACFTDPKVEVGSTFDYCEGEQRSDDDITRHPNKHFDKWKLYFGKGQFDGDEILVWNTVIEATHVPLPGSAPLYLLGIAGAALVFRQKANT